MSRYAIVDESAALVVSVHPSRPEAIDAFDALPESVIGACEVYPVGPDGDVRDENGRTLRLNGHEVWLERGAR